ncbi:MAG: hypothetical protein VW405_01930 [Rhodospirillaceae bacterium]
MSYPIPTSLQRVFARAPTSKAAALKAMCLACVGFVRADIRDCSDLTCPLWHHRPYSGAKKARKRAISGARIDAEA